MAAPHRIALVSDIHGNVAALEAVLADLDARGLETVFNLGDHVSGPLWPRETASLLMARGWPSIRGNHDRMVTDDPPTSHGPSDAFAAAAIDEAQRAWLAALPATLDLQAYGLFLCHGIPSDDRLYLLESPVDGRLVAARPDQIARRLGRGRAAIVACGHSHIPRVVHHGATLIVNPGSVGLPAYEHTGAHAHVSEVGSPLARYAVLELGVDGPRVESIALPYDAEAAATRAEANGRSDWAHALRTGYARRA